MRVRILEIGDEDRQDCHYGGIKTATVCSVQICHGGQCKMEIMAPRLPILLRRERNYTAPQEYVAASCRDGDAGNV